MRRYFKWAIGIVGLSLLSVNSFAEEYTSSSSTNLQQQNEGSPAEKNQLQGKAFLLANKSKPGVVTLPDGLEYKILTPGKGAKPTDTDIVTVHYSGKLINGQEFDSSYKRGEPTTFPVSGVIPGWVEALKLMNVGSTWELYIPSTLAYGERGAPPLIGPNETLIFKVQLLDVKKQ